MGTNLSPPEGHDPNAVAKAQVGFFLEHGYTEETVRSPHLPGRVAPLPPPVRCDASEPAGSTSARCNLERGHDGRHHARVGDVGASVVWEPSAEMREVPAKKARDGDIVLFPARVTEVRGDYIHATYGVNGGLVIEIDTPGLTVYRPVLPLPEREGAVIRCRISSRIESYVAERYKGRWLVAGLPNPDQSGWVSRGFGDDQITEVITLLDPGRAPTDGQDQ